MKNILSVIRSLLARAAFWRKAAPAPDASAADTLPAEAATAPEPPMDLPPTDLALADLPPVSMPEHNANALPVSGHGDSQESADAPPKPPLAKRILVFLFRKSVWMPAAALTIMAVSVTATIGILQARHKEESKALPALQAEKAKLEAENQKLKEAAREPVAPPQPAIIPAKDSDAPQEQTSKPDPAFDIPARAAEKPKTARASGECLLTDKDAGDSLKRCIEAFNQFDKR